MSDRTRRAVTCSGTRSPPVEVDHRRPASRRAKSRAFNRSRLPHRRDQRQPRRLEGEGPDDRSGAAHRWRKGSRLSRSTSVRRSRMRRPPSRAGARAAQRSRRRNTGRGRWRRAANTQRIGGGAHTVSAPLRSPATITSATFSGVVLIGFLSRPASSWTRRSRGGHHHVHPRPVEEVGEARAEAVDRRLRRAVGEVRLPDALTATDESKTIVPWPCALSPSTTGMITETLPITLVCMRSRLAARSTRVRSASPSTPKATSTRSMSPAAKASATNAGGCRDRPRRTSGAARRWRPPPSARARDVVERSGRRPQGDGAGAFGHERANSGEGDVAAPPSTSTDCTNRAHLSRVHRPRPSAAPPVCHMALRSFRFSAVLRFASCSFTGSPSTSRRRRARSECMTPSGSSRARISRQRSSSGYMVARSSGRSRESLPVHAAARGDHEVVEIVEETGQAGEAAGCRARASSPVSGTRADRAPARSASARPGTRGTRFAEAATDSRTCPPARTERRTGTGGSRPGRTGGSSPPRCRAGGRTSSSTRARRPRAGALYEPQLVEGPDGEALSRPGVPGRSRQPDVGIEVERGRALEAGRSSRVA